jgi:hypothetical protein
MDTSQVLEVVSEPEFIAYVVWFIVGLFGNALHIFFKLPGNTSFGKSVSDYMKQNSMGVVTGVVGYSVLFFLWANGELVQLLNMIPFMQIPADIPPNLASVILGYSADSFCKNALKKFSEKFGSKEPEEQTNNKE